MFKPGDMVRRIGLNTRYVKVGGVYEVANCYLEQGRYVVALVDHFGEYFGENFELVKPKERELTGLAKFFKEVEKRA